MPSTEDVWPAGCSRRRRRLLALRVAAAIALAGALAAGVVLLWHEGFERDVPPGQELRPRPVGEAGDTASAVACAPPSVELTRSSDGAMQAFMFFLEARNLSGVSCRMSTEVTLSVFTESGDLERVIEGNPARASLDDVVASGEGRTSWSFFHEPCGSGILTFEADFGPYGRMTWPFEVPSCGEGPDNPPSLMLVPPTDESTASTSR